MRLADQDRAHGIAALVAEGQAIVRACLRRNRPGPYQIQAAIAVHSDAATTAGTDWRQIVSLYDHAGGVAHAGRGAQPGGGGGRGGRSRPLELLDELDGALAEYHLHPPPAPICWSDSVVSTSRAAYGAAIAHVTNETRKYCCSNGTATAA